MKINKHYWILIGVLIAVLLLPNASALLDHKELDYSKSYLTYPTIIHKDILGQEVQSFSIIKNTDECLIDCKAEQIIGLKYEGELVEDIRFIDSRGKEYNIPYTIKYETTEEYNIDTPIYKEVCKDIEIKDNKTEESIIKNICNDEINDYTKEIKTRTIWKDYILNEKMLIGKYNIIIEAKKSMGQRIDWQIKANGIWNEEQAWWDSSWGKCRDLNVSQGYAFNNRTDVSIFEIQGSGWNADGSDVRIINDSCGNGGIEVPYNLLKATADNINVSFKVTNLTGTGVSQYSAYYGNAGASTTENNEIPRYYLNETNLNVSFGNIGVWTLQGAGIKLSKEGDLGYGSTWAINTYNPDSRVGNATSSYFYLGDSFYYFGGGKDKICINLSVGTIDCDYQIATIGWSAKNTINTANISGQLATILIQDSNTGGGGWLFYYDGNATLGGISLKNYPIYTSLGKEQEGVNGLKAIQSIPATNYNTTNPSITFNCSGEDETGIYNLSLIIDGKYNYTVNDGGAGDLKNLSLQITRTMSQGYHTWNCNASDDANSATSALRYLNVDSISPTITIIYPTTGNKNTSISTLNYTYSDANPRNCNMSANIGTGNSSVISSGINFTGIISAEGTNIWSLQCNDTFGNINTASVTFFRDTIYPDINMTSPLNISYNVAFIDMNYTVGDANLFSCWYSLSEGTVNISITCGDNRTDTPVLTEGSNTWWVWVNDTSSNINSSSITFYVDAIPPTVAIEYPANTTYNVSVDELNYTITDSGTPDSCIYSLDGGASNFTETTAGNNFTAVGFVQGSNTATLFCNDTVNNWGDDAVTFFIDSIYPDIDWGDGTEADGVFVKHDWIYINTTWTEINFKNINFLIDGTTSSSVTYSTPLYAHNFTSLADGFYTYNATICDIANNCNTTSTRNITLDTINPSYAITLPTANESTLSMPYNVTTTVVWTDTNLAECWYITSENITATNYTCNAAQEITFNNPGIYNITSYANDSAGNQNSTFITYFINYIQPAMTITTPVVEGENHVVYFNVTATSLLQSNATVNYNGTLSIMNQIFSNGTFAQYSKTLTAPFVASNIIMSVNVGYYVNGDSWNDATQNQTVYNIPALDINGDQLCDGNMSYSFNLFDEINTATMLNGTWIYNLNYGLSNTTFLNAGGTIAGTTNISICVNATVSPLFRIGFGQIGYSAVGYDSKIYHFALNSLMLPLSSVNLYLLNTTGTTILVAKIIDSNLIAQKNVDVKMLRYYPLTDSWSIVEQDISDELGQTIFHVIQNTVNYKFMLSNSTGSILYTTDTVKVVCYATPCQIELTIPSTSESPAKYYTDASGVSYSLSYNNNTQIVSMLFNSLDGTSKTIQLLANQINISNDLIVCNNVTTGIAGLLTCNLTAYTGNFLAQAYINTTHEMNILDQISVSTANFFRTTGTEGILYGMLFIIALVMVGIWNPVASIVLAMIGFILMGVIGFIAIGWAILISIIILGVIVVVQLK